MSQVQTKNYASNFTHLSEIKNDTPKDIIRIFRKAMLTQYETDTVLTPYADELALMNCVKNGNETDLRRYLKQMEKFHYKAGHMADDRLKQAQYYFVSGITLITRYAIAGGLPENEAFHLSDAYLQKISRTREEKEPAELFLTAIQDFTKRVHKAKTSGTYSYSTTRCIRYILDHLHHPLKLTVLAVECKVTPQYLSSLFHREVGITITAYITKEKMKTAAQMLEQSDFPIHRIADLLAFPSQSSFSSQFKKLYGMTPLHYRKVTFQTHEEL